MSEMTREEMLKLTTQRLLDIPSVSDLLKRYPKACEVVLEEEWKKNKDFIIWKLDDSFYGGVDSLLSAAIVWLDENHFSECIDGDKEELWVSVLHEDGTMVERFLTVIERELSNG